MTFRRIVWRIISRIWLGKHYLSCWLATRRTLRKSRSWRRRWPNHCKSCLGWGGAAVHNYPHEPDDFDVCDVPADERTCHRCGELGLTPEEAEGPCSFCGWNSDDGLPELDDYCGCDSIRDQRLGRKYY